MLTERNDAMRILVYGAGVIGANLAADLTAGGKDVTLLARGAWADTLEEKGLVIDAIFAPGRRTYRIPVIRKLAADDVYDAIFVVMRCTQLDGIIPALAANESPTIVLVGNNLNPEAYVERLPGKRVLFAFSMAAGHREPDRVVSISLHKITIGPACRCPVDEKPIRGLFAGSRLNVAVQPNMADYLLCHAAFVVPIAFACYHCDGDLRRIKADRAYLNRIIDANIEGYAAIEGAGHEILPASDKDYRSPRYRRLSYLVYKVMCATVIGKICASDHAMNATEEMSALAEDLKRFYAAVGAPCPTYLVLEQDTKAYLHANCVSAASGRG